MLYKKKLFNPTGATMPIRILITEDSDFIVSDHNYKVLGCVKNEDKLKNFDFVLPIIKDFGINQVNIALKYIMIGFIFAKMKKGIMIQEKIHVGIPSFILSNLMIM